MRPTVRHAAFRPAVDRHRRSTGKGAFPAVDPCRLCVQLPMHALPCRTRAAYGSRPRQLRMDIPVPHGRARRTADSARPRTAADPLLRAVGVHLRQNAGEYAGLAPFRRLDGRTARRPRAAASGLAGRNTRPDRHDPRQTEKNRGALPLSGTHDPLREHKFGDCKALSNYLHAMLAACDIESFYTIIHTQNKHIPRDFATPAIANHAILGVPCQRDTLWLECTNTDVPFGYVHQSIAGHDAVICHDGKAEVVTLPAYADSLNTECQRIDVRLDEAGNASLSLSSVSRARQYEWTRPILDLARDKQADFLRRSFQLPLAQVDSLRCEEVLDKPLPEMHIRASITALRYANKTGSRLFVPVAPLRSGPGRFTAERRHDLWIDKGYCDTDSLTLHLPEGYVVEALPKSVTIENRFGKVAHPHPPAAPFGPLPAKRVCSLPRIHAGRRPRLFGQNRPAQGINDRSATPERVVADRLKGAAETGRRIPKPTISGCSDDAPRRGRSSWRNSLRRPGSDLPPSGWPDKPAPTARRPFRRRDSPSRRP